MTTNKHASKDLQKELDNFLKQYNCKTQNLPYTNTCMGKSARSYHIPECDYDMFLDIYSKCVRAGLELHITEKPLQISPLRVDLDFRFDNKDVQMEIKDDKEFILHKYKQSHVKAIVKEYFKILNDNFDIDADNQVAYVHEKPYAGLHREKIKDGIHIVFPHINMSYELQHYVRSEMLKCKVFEAIGFTNKIDDVIDKAIIDQNCWLMYGSKKIESYVYQVSSKYTYDISTQEAQMQELNCNIQDYVNLFSMRRPGQTNVLISHNSVHEFVEKWNQSAEKKSVLRPKKLLDLTYDSKQDIELAKQLVKCLSESRADKYDDWINLGWTLHNINESEELLNVWDEFSQTGSSYKSGECQKLWWKMKTEKQGMATLKYWAKNDNPAMYEKVLENSLIPLIDQSIRSDGAHGDVADVIAKYMKDKVVYDSKAKSWFYVDDTNKWRSETEATFIYKLCKTDICRLYMERSTYYNRMYLNSTDEGQKDICLEKSKKSLKIGQILKNSDFVKKIIPQMKAVMYVDDFIESYLDCNINLLAFKNKVYDLKKCEFRDIEPTDYINITTGYDYDEDIDESIVQEVQDIIKSMFVTDEEYCYVLDIITTMIYGNNKYQEFYIMTGAGSNGKSVLMNAITQMLGKYARKIGVDTFTKPTRSANSTSELYDCRGTRFTYAAEPAAEDKLTVNVVKDLTGDDLITTRGLYSNPISYKPQFKIVLCCNDLIQLSKVDNGIARRIRVIEFKYKFFEESDSKYDPDNRYHKILDRSLNEKFNDDVRYRQAFAKLVCDNWKNKVKDMPCMGTPACVKEASSQYIKECNEVMAWFEDEYETTNNKEDVVKARDMFNDFKFQTRNKTISETSFGCRLNDMGIEKVSLGKNKISHRVGIKKKDKNVEFVQDD
jgi:P4 family phage/plasmid primase-like protien